MSEISNLGTRDVIAEELTNETGDFDPVLRLAPDSGMRILLRNYAKDGVGIPVYADLVDANGNPLPIDTRLCWKWDAPGLDQRQIVSDIITNIRSYNTLSINEQQDDEMIDQVRHRLKSNGFAVDDDEELLLCIDSSAQIDWTNSSVYLDDGATRVVSGD